MPGNFPTTLPNDASLLKANDFLVTTLNGSFAGGAVTLTVVSTTGFPDPTGVTGTFYVVIDATSTSTREIVGYTGLTGTTFTGCTRGLFGTTNQAHATGVTCEQNNVAAYHEMPKNEILNIATKVGVNSSGVNTTHDFKLSGVATGDKASSLTGTETLTNKTLTAPHSTSPVIDSGGLTITAGGLVVSSGSVTITVNNLVFNGTSQAIVAPTTSLLINNHANTVTNVTLTDAGVMTIAAGLTVTTGGLTVSAGGFTVTGGITALGTSSSTYNSQYVSARFVQTFSATPTFNFNNGNVQAMTLTANVTSSTFSNPISGGRYCLVLTQDATGGRTFVFPGSVKWSQGTAPTLSGASKADLVALVYDGTNFYATASLNY